MMQLLGICCFPPSDASGHSNIALKPRAKGTYYPVVWGGATNLHTEHDVKLLALGVFTQVCSVKTFRGSTAAVEVS